MKYLVLQEIHKLETGVTVNLIGIYDTADMAKEVARKVWSKIQEKTNDIDYKPVIRTIEENTTYSFQCSDIETLKGQVDKRIELITYTDSNQYNCYVPIS